MAVPMMPNPITPSRGFPSVFIPVSMNRSRSGAALARPWLAPFTYYYRERYYRKRRPPTRSRFNTASSPQYVMAYVVWARTIGFAR